MREIDPEKGLKLTSTGSLPVKTVKAIYEKRYLTDDIIESGIAVLRRETDSLIVHTTRIIAELAGYARKRNGRLYATKRGHAIRTASDVLLRLITTYGETYNQAYADGYPSDLIAQVGHRYSMYLLKKHGGEPRDARFYDERYFRAFPHLHADSSSDFDCYASRTFEGFLVYLGFARQTGHRNPTVEKTAQFDRYVVFNADPRPPDVEIMIVPSN